MESTHNILEVKNLTVGFRNGQNLDRAVDGVSFSIRRGELLALVGESGSGKSVTSLALMGLLPEATAVVENGSAVFCGMDLLAQPPETLRKIRGKRLSMIFQEPMTALNPVLSIGWQISEVLRQHGDMTAAQARDTAVELLEQVGISSAETRYNDYPHQLSGGMRQRVMIAMALACRPELLIADEPTTALDVTVQAQIMDLLNTMRLRLGTAVLFITHNLALVREQASRVAVMVSGRIVETARVDELFSNPCHPYTRLLLHSVPQAENRGHKLASIEGLSRQDADLQGCAFCSRCPFATDECRTFKPEAHLIGTDHVVFCLHHEAFSMTTTIAADIASNADSRPADLLTVRDLKVWFPNRSGLLNRVTGHVKAVDGVSLTLHAGETLALVGESGCGKTTVGKALLGLVPTTDGQIELNGLGTLNSLRRQSLQDYRKQVQMVFQDPFSSLDPRLMIAETLQEGLELHGLGKSPDERKKYLENLMTTVGLPPDALMRYPHQFSGGQRQRIGLARALSVSPQILICDECTSALDVSVQAQILNLLQKLQRDMNLAYLFITHDLSIVSYFADRVAVMYLGRIVEEGTADEIFTSPKHPYTQALLAAAPKLQGESSGKLRLEGDVPSPLSPPAGCHFHPRCPLCQQRCLHEPPPRRSLSPSHTFVCWCEH